jgi:ligand-binding sensor domain-containing protein
MQKRTNDHGVLFRSEQSGTVWTRSDAGLTNQTVDALAIDSAGTIYAANYYGVHRSTDNGGSWVLTGPAGVDLKSKGLAFDSRGDLYLATEGEGIWQLMRDSTTWTQLKTGGVYSLFCASNDDLYSANYRSTDGGATWTEMPINYFTSSFAENSLGHLFCGTFNYGSGVWRSTNRGNTWSQINTGLPIMDVRAVAVDANDYFYAGTNGESVFKTTAATATSVADPFGRPTAFFLEQNYPNPFNPSTTIRYGVPKKSAVRLTVYSSLGQEVATLVEGEREAGYHKVTFNAFRLTSGIYIYRLQAGDLIQSRKLLVLR